ncbi:MAG: hypothetical protein IPO81_04020 [Kouleothrix sp.]|nr:hypothetical protein [Kouleothrix sp.]
MTVRDLLAKESQSIICQSPATNSTNCPNWPGWGSADYPGNPTAGTGLYSDPTVPATEASPGPETFIAGSGAKPNVGDNSFTGPVVLDFRQVTFPSPLFYNGLTPSTALNTYKDFATKYILGTYPGPLVIPGQELAYYNGVSAGQTIKPFDQRYSEGQIVAALMYNGTINTDPDFSVTFPAPSNSQASRPAGTFSSGSATCSVPAGETFDGESGNQTQRLPDAAYKINVLPQTYSNFKLRAFISSDDPDKWEGAWNGGSALTFNINGAAPAVSISTIGKNLDFNARPTRKFTCTDPLLGTTTDYPSRKDGAQTIYLEVQDTATSKRRAVYAFLDQDADPNDFYAYFSEIPIAYQPLEPGQSSSAELKLEKAGSGSKLDVGNAASQVKVDAINWYSPSDLNSVLTTGTTLNGVTVGVSKQGSKNLLSVSTTNSAVTGKEYYLRIQLSYSGFKHYVWYYVSVRTQLSNASGISQFVYALGYANFKITDIGSNYIKGRAVSDLKLTPSEIVSGFQPRLLAWQ